VNPHVAAAHVAVACAGVAHALSHAPQFIRSVCGSMHVPAQRISVATAQALAHT
jgi:hypothetical protein